LNPHGSERKKSKGDFLRIKEMDEGPYTGEAVWAHEKTRSDQTVGNQSEGDISERKLRRLRKKKTKKQARGQNKQGSGEDVHREIGNTWKKVAQATGKGTG